MGAKRSSSFSFCGMLKACFSGGSNRDNDYWEDDVNRRIFASDEDDRRRWVAEPGIDRKASAFIDKYYATRVSQSEQQFASKHFWQVCQK